MCRRFVDKSFDVRRVRAGAANFQELDVSSDWGDSC